MEARFSKGTLYSSAEPFRIEVLEGILWVTEGDGGSDHLVSAGQARAFAPGARIVAEALTESRVRITSGCGQRTTPTM